MATKGKILIVTGDGGESYETLYAKHRFEEAGYQSVVAAPSRKLLNLVIHDFEPGWDTYTERKGYYLEADISIADANAGDFVAIMIIGGRAPEYLRNDSGLIALVQTFDKQGKYIFAICHGIQVLVTAQLVRDKHITCYEHVRFEVESCGGTFVGKDQAVQDGRIVTGQTWQSHPEFYRLVFTCLK
ncbi:MAG: DJ-1/PfpI family protein [Cyclobacteriaceae bacterium]|nr:DJ-1/PfpI family protein [Cyclobacteriaceae bacterium]